MPTVPLAAPAPNQGAGPGPLPDAAPRPPEGAGTAPRSPEGADTAPRSDIAPLAAARQSGPSAAALAAAVLGLALLLYYPTLGASWAYDDIDYINQAADCMAGKLGFLDLLLRPQGEHVVAGFRLALFASLKLFGVTAFPFRLFVLVAHAGSAFLLGLVARRYSTSGAGSAAAGWAAGLLYLAACGFSSMWIWFPSGSTVPFAMAALTGALALLAHRDRLGVRRSRLLAGVLVLTALLTESTLAPMALVPAALDEYERRRAGARRPVGPFTVFCLAAAAAVAALASLVYTRTFGPHLSVSVRHGLPRFAFLLLAAPFRLFFPGLQVLASEPGLRTALLGSLLGLAVAAPAAALLLVLWRQGRPRLAMVAALATVGPLGVLGLVGLGRWRNSYWELYDADRYFFTLLVPLALLAGAVAATAAGRLAAWPRRSRWALLALLAVGLGAELALHRRAMLGRIPFDVYQAHEDRFAQLGRLAARLQAAARALPPGEPPLAVPDAALWFPDVHNGQITTRTLLHVIARGSEPRLRLGGPAVAARDARVLDRVFDEWAREIGAPLPYLSIVDGRLTDAHVIRFADFRTGPQAAAVVSGFFPWEGTSRWMGKRGELRLTLTSPSLVFYLAVPPEALGSGALASGPLGSGPRGSGPGERPIRVQVTAVDEAIGWAAPLGTLAVERPDLQLYRLDATPFLSRLGNGRAVHLVLESDRTWRPSGTIPGSADVRDLAVQVFAAGCE